MAARHRKSYQHLYEDEAPRPPKKVGGRVPGLGSKGRADRPARQRMTYLGSGSQVERDVMASDTGISPDYLQHWAERASAHSSQRHREDPNTPPYNYDIYDGRDHGDHIHHERGHFGTLGGADRPPHPHFTPKDEHLAWHPPGHNHPGATTHHPDDRDGKHGHPRYDKAGRDNYRTTGIRHKEAEEG